MKPKLTPTSPKQRPSNKEIPGALLTDSSDFNHPQRKRSTLSFSAFFFAMLIGLLSGVIGCALVLLYGEQLNIPGLSLRNVETTLSLGSSKDTTAQLKELAGNMQRGTIQLFRKKQSTDNVFAPVYLDADRLGFAATLTNDGVCATTEKVLDDISIDYVAMASDGSIFSVDHIQVDPLTKVRFFHIATNKTIALSFVTDDAVQNGSQVYAFPQFAVGPHQAFFSSFVADKLYSDTKSVEDLTFTSEQVPTHYRIGTQATTQLDGLSAVTQDGKLLGIFLDNDTILPIRYMRVALDQVLGLKEVSRAFLGVNYIDLARNPNIASDLTQGRKEGALVASSRPDRLAVQKGSPAQKAGIKENDIIVAINGTKLDTQVSLPDLIQALAPGTIVTASILRDGIALDLKIELEIL